MVRPLSLTSQGQATPAVTTDGPPRSDQATSSTDEPPDSPSTSDAAQDSETQNILDKVRDAQQEDPHLKFLFMWLDGNGEPATEDIKLAGKAEKFYWIHRNLFMVVTV